MRAGAGIAAIQAAAGMKETIPMTQYESDLRYVRRLSRLLGVLTVMLLVVLGFYLWPMVRDRFFPAAGARPITPRGDLMDMEKTTIAIYKHASASVVFIATDAARFNPFNRSVTDVPQGSGSGFIWDEQGHIVTNYHVIRDASARHVILADQTSYDAEVVGVDSDHDLAVLKINPSLGTTLVPINIGSSHDLQVGQAVFAIGNPFGLDQTMTTGIISALDRSIKDPSGNEIDGVIQTDAAINPGNSGGTLLDSAGRLIGVNAAILSESGTWTGIGFAIPVDTANRVVPQIILHGRYQRAHIGVRFTDGVTAPKGVQGVAVAATDPGSPAEQAGVTGAFSGVSRGRFRMAMRSPDIITQINDKPIKNTSDFYTILDNIPPGTAIKVTLWHDGATRQVTMTTQ